MMNYNKKYPCFLSIIGNVLLTFTRNFFAFPLPVARRYLFKVSNRADVFGMLNDHFSFSTT